MTTKSRRSTSGRSVMLPFIFAGSCQRDSKLPAEYCCCRSAAPKLLKFCNDRLLINREDLQLSFVTLDLSQFMFNQGSDFGSSADVVRVVNLDSNRHGLFLKILSWRDHA